jgi:ribosomal protein S18 acetylase RimI-like enzyme
MRSDLTLREATEEDLPAILRLYAQPAMNDGRVLELEAAREIFRRMARYPNFRVYVAVRSNTVVGTFELLVMDNLGGRGTPSAVVEDVCVDEAAQGQGIGRAMMEFAMAEAARCGCYKLTLSSNLRREQAHTFYRSLGFEQHGLSFRVGLP